jgi:hypothetical protein
MFRSGGLVSGTLKGYNLILIVESDQILLEEFVSDIFAVDPSIVDCTLRQECDQWFIHGNAANS